MATSLCVYPVHSYPASHYAAGIAMSVELVRRYLLSPFLFGPWLVVGFASGFAFDISTISALLFTGALAVSALLPWLASFIKWHSAHRQGVEVWPVFGVLLGWLIGFLARGVAF